MNIKRSPNRQSRKRGGSPRAQPSPELPLIETPYWEVMLRSLLPKVTPQDLALVAAGLSRGRSIDEKTATALINDACMLLGMAASKLAFVTPQPTGMVPPIAAPPREISGAAFLRKNFPGSDPVSLARRREFARRAIPLFEQSRGVDASGFFQSPAGLDGWLDNFKTRKLTRDQLTLLKSIVVQIKESPEAQQKRTKAREKGGLMRTTQQLTEYLRANGGVAHFETLIRDRRYTQASIESLISNFPRDFEKVEHKWLPAVRLRNSKKILKHT